MLTISAATDGHIHSVSETKKQKPHFSRRRSLMVKIVFFLSFSFFGWCLSRCSCLLLLTFIATFHSCRRTYPLFIFIFGAASWKKKATTVIIVYNKANMHEVDVWFTCLIEMASCPEDWGAAARLCRPVQRLPATNEVVNEAFIIKKGSAWQLCPAVRGESCGHGQE